MLRERLSDRESGLTGTGSSPPAHAFLRKPFQGDLDLVFVTLLIPSSHASHCQRHLTLAPNQSWHVQDKELQRAHNDRLKTSHF
jgi:hypothetical protein